ncbi:MAG TPA: IPT/TIG domain-containing protein, partial [Actinomycetota bacterium]|nr:IPT/TIG domain-containing protein [Actinomycetota bacterium]
IFAGLGAAALVEAGWRRVGLPGSGPATFLPLRWIRHRIAHRHVAALIQRLQQSPPQPSRESLSALLDLSRELARRDIYTRAHSGRVSRLSVEIGQRIGLSADECEIARLAGLLHDIGKLEIPASILNKPGPLDPDEAELVRHHPMIGAALVAPYIGPDIVNAVRHQHERIDGAGYHDGVEGDALPTIARFVPVVDTYDALISDRAYRPGRSREEAFMELRAVAGTQLDPEMVEALIEVESAKVPFGAGVLGLAPVSALFRKAEHVLHGSAAPAAAAVTAIAVAGAGWLGVMSNRTGTHVLASRSTAPAIVTTTPSATPEGGSSPEASAAPGETPAETPLPTATDATGKTVAPLYFPQGKGSTSGAPSKQGVLVTPPKANPSAPNQPTQPTVVGVGGPSPIPPNPPPPSQQPPPPPGAPTLTGISPTSGAAGTSVQISGSNFSGITGVQFGGSPAAGFTVDSPTRIAATAPGGSGRVAVTVTGPGGKSQAAQFTYVGPSVTTLAPMFGPAGTPVTISGNNLSGALAVSFGNAPAASFKVNSNTSITAISPNFAGTQEVNISVTTPAGTWATPPGVDLQFDYGPNVTSIRPSSGGAGTSVTISGTNLRDVTEVRFGANRSLTLAVSPDGTSVTAVAPAPSGKNVDIIAVNPAGGSDAGGFDVFSYAAPSISSLSPSSGNGGTAVKISGQNLAGASSVRFGSANATFTSNADGSINAIAPAGLNNAQQVTVSSPAGTSNGQTFTYPAPPPPPTPGPTISSISPNSGPHTVATGVTIQGANFTGATCSVKGTAITPIPCTVASATTI